MAWVSLGSEVWGSAPAIPISFEGEEQIVGKSWRYRARITVSPVNGDSYFGYPIYVGITMEGVPLKTATLKESSPSRWDSAITYTSEWCTFDTAPQETVVMTFNVYSGSGSSRNETYYGIKAVSRIPSSVSAQDGVLSSTLYLYVEKYNEDHSQTITYYCAGEQTSMSGTVCENSTSDVVAWDNSNGNVSHLAQLNKTGQSVTVTFTITTYAHRPSGEITVVGTNSTTVTMAIPYEVRPGVALSVEDAAGYLTAYGAFIQGWSKLKLTANPQLAHGSPINLYQFNADGVTYREPDTSYVVPKTFVVPSVIQGSGTLSVGAHVTDCRTHSSDWVWTDITVLPYANPSVTVLAYRCNSSGDEDIEGAYMRVGFNAALADLNGKNSASYSLTYSGASSPITGKGTSYLSAVIPCDTNQTWSVEVTVSDKLTSTTKSAVIPTAFTLIDFYSTGHGLALGKVASRDGFDCAMDAYFTGNVNVAGKLLVDLIYPVGSIYMSTNNVSPQTFFGGTWERIQDRFLLAAGSTYAAGGTGGSATHTLTISEMPNHDHVLKVATSSTSASDAALRASSVKAYSSQLADSPNDNIKDVGGNAAHNNMPPYLTVYMWKRSK